MSPWILLLGCRPAPAPSVEAALSEDVATVVEISLDDHSPEETPTWVEYGPKGSFPHRADFEWVDGRWQALLVGNKPESEVDYRLAMQVSERRVERTEAETILTGGVPSWLASLEVDSSVERPLAGQVLLTTRVMSPAAAIIVDGDGDYLWWAELDAFEMMARARLARDGRSILVLPVNLEGHEAVEIQRIGFDGQLIEGIPMPRVHHDFVELEDGGFAALALDERELDGQTVRGDALIRRDADGQVTTLWSVFDQFDPSAAAHLEDGDWSHGNSVAMDPDTGGWLLTFFGLSAVVGLDAEANWSFTLGGSEGSLLNGDGELIGLGRVHQAMRASSGELWVFENEEEGSSMGDGSRASAFRVNVDEGIAHKTWAYVPEPTLNTLVLGDVEELPGEGRVVAFSSNGRIDQVSAEGERQWRLSAGIGQAFGFIELMSWP